MDFNDVTTFNDVRTFNEDVPDYDPEEFPEILSQNETIRAIEGQPIYLLCRVSNLFDYQVRNIHKYICYSSMTYNL